MTRLVAVVALALLVGCTGDGDRAATTTTTVPAPTVPPADAGAEDLAAAVGCDVETSFAELQEEMIAPVRGGAARDGVSCRLDGADVDLFVRNLAAIGPAPGMVPGTVEHIDRLVGSGVEGGCSGWVAVGETWFALADDAAALADLADDLGGAVREVLPAAPPASYSAPGCP